MALVSNIMAIVLQSLCARLAIASGRDLAQACRDAYPKPVAIALWFLAELAIVATALAEVIGTAIGLNLLLRASRVSSRKRRLVCLTNAGDSQSCCGTIRRSVKLRNDLMKAWGTQRGGSDHDRRYQTILEDQSRIYVTERIVRAIW